MFSFRSVSAGANRMLLLPLSLTNLLVFTDSFLIFLLGPQLSTEFNLTLAQYSTLLATNISAMGIAGLFVAKFVTWRSRRGLLIAAAACYILTSILTIFSVSFDEFLLFRVVAGAALGIAATATLSLPGDLFNFTETGRAFTLIWRVRNVSVFTTLPLFMMVASWLNVKTCFGFLGVLALGSLLSWLRTSQNVDYQRSIPKIGYWNALKDLARNRELRSGLAFSATSSFGQAILNATFMLIVVSNMKFESDKIPILIFIMGLSNFFLVPKIIALMSRYSRVRTYFVISLVHAVVFSLFCFAGTLGPVPSVFVCVLTILNFMLMAAREVSANSMLSAVSTDLPKIFYFSFIGALQNFFRVISFLPLSYVLVRGADGRIAGMWGLAALVTVCFVVSGYLCTLIRLGQDEVDDLLEKYSSKAG